jgi:hypothetical protein
VARKRSAGAQCRAALERRLGRPIPEEPGDDHLIDRLFARARELDPEAWGIRPDRMDQTSRTEAERQMQNRRTHALKLALDEHICAGNAVIAAALRTLEEAPPH